MDHRLTKFNDFFYGNLQFVIPIYQRGYTWDKIDWTYLWRDIAYKYLEIATLCKGETPKIHFMGTTITQTSTGQNIGDNPVHTIVDGQQRIISIYTLLCAKRDYEAFLSKSHIPDPNSLSHIMDPSGININPPLRFIVQKDDRKALNAISSSRAFKNDKEYSIDYKHKLIKLYQFFIFLLWRGTDSLHHALEFNELDKDFLPPEIPKEGFIEKTLFSYWENLGNKPSDLKYDLKVLNRVITQYFQVLNILVDDNNDEDAAIIFESVNSKTVVLSEFDHLKNSVFARLPKTREEVYKNEWTPIIVNIFKARYEGLSNGKQGDQFIYDYLISRGISKRKGINKSRSYTQFMSFLDSQIIGPINRGGYEEDFTRFLKNNFLYSGAMWPAAIGDKTDIELGPNRDYSVPDEASKIIKSIIEISAGPPVPLILHLLEGHSKDKIKNIELCDLLKLIESFLVRNCLIGTPMSPFRSLFSQIMDNYSDSYDRSKLGKTLIDRGWPEDRDILKGVFQYDLYDKWGGRTINAILRGLEEELAGPGAHPLNFGKAKYQYSVEHVFPKSQPNKAWLDDFDKWGLNQTQKDELYKRKHSLGNLTAVCNHDNKKLSKKSFEKKCELYEEMTNLRLNESIVDKEKWTSTEIDARTEKLVKVALKKWPRSNNF